MIQSAISACRVLLRPVKRGWKAAASKYNYKSRAVPIRTRSTDVVEVAIYSNWNDVEECIALMTPGGSGRWGNVQFRSARKCKIADFILILNRPEVGKLVIHAPPDRVWFACGEPPVPKFRQYQAGQGTGTVVLTSDPEVVGDAQINQLRTVFLRPAVTRTWIVKRSMSELATMRPQKTALLSWVTSNYRVLDGHKRRMAFLEKITGRVHFDLFGTGFNPIPDKFDGIAPYRYSIAFENCVSPYYFTEKLMDCFVCLTMPLYVGSPEIERFFPPKSFIRIDPDSPNVIETLQDIINSDLWAARRTALEEARWLTLNKYNFFGRVADEIGRWPLTRRSRTKIIVRAPRL